MPGWEGSAEHESDAVYLRQIQKWLVEEGGRLVREHGAEPKITYYYMSSATTAKAWLVNIN